MAIAPTTSSPAFGGLAAAGVTPPPSDADVSATGLADDFNTFLTLLTTQLQNQDPLDPTDSNEFTNQLVAFTGVEQQIRTNDNLETLADLTRVNNLASVAAFLGQDALVRGDVVTNEGNGATFQYALPVTAEQTSLEVLDIDGNIVFSQDGEIAFGPHIFDWTGITNSGVQAPPGIYQLRVTSLNSDGSTLPVAISVQDTITEVDTTASDPVFTVGVNEVTQAGILRLIAASPLAPVSPSPTDPLAGDDVTDAATELIEDLVNQ